MRAVPQNEDQRMADAEANLAAITTDITKGQELLQAQGKSHKERTEAFAKEEADLEQKLADKKNAAEEEGNRIDGEMATKRAEHVALIAAHEQLGVEHEALQQDHNTLGTRHSVQLSAFENAQGQEKAALERIGLLKKEESDLQESIKTGETRLGVINGQIDQVTNDLTEKTGRVEILDRRIQQLEEDIQNPLRVKNETEAQVETLRAELTALETEITDGKAELVTIGEKKTAELAEIATARAELDTRARGLGILDSQIDSKIGKGAKLADVEVAKTIAEEKGIA